MKIRDILCVVLFCVLLLVTFTYGYLLYVHYQDLHHKQQELVQLQKEFQKNQAQLEEMKKIIERIEKKDPAIIARIAREYFSMVRQGEKVYTLDTQEIPPATPAPQK